MTPTFPGKTISRASAVLIVWGLFATVCADGLPGEYLLSNRWRDLLWQHSPLANPACLTQENFITLRGAFAPVLQGAYKLWEFGATVPFDRHSFGVTLLGENDAAIQHAEYDAASERLVTSGETSSNNNVFSMLTYAINPVGGLSLGANLGIAYQSNFGQPLWGTGFDVGCMYRILHHPVAGNHSLGLSTVNLISPSMGSSISPRFGNAGEYSRDVRLSWMGGFFENRLESGLDIDLKDLLSKRDEFVGRKIEWGGAWRVGFRVLPVLPVFLQMGFGETVVEYWGLAGGVTMPLAGDGQKITMMYQYNLKTEGDMASAHTFYFVMNLGKPRGKLRNDVRQAAARPDRAPADSSRATALDSLRKIKGITIDEQKEFIKITAAEVAVHFVSGSSKLPPEALKALAEIARFLEKYPGYPASIEGHTDSDPIVGRLKAVYPDNKALSKARAEKVKEYFVVTERLPARLFTTVGWGETRPLGPNDTEENKTKNRRVVVIVKTQSP